MHAGSPAPHTDATPRIRPIRADDGERLRDHHHRLSPESRYRRFLAAKPELTTADARYLVDVDGVDHQALVATVGAAGEEQIVGVARCIRLPDRPEVAEVAVVVVDGHQHQGLGRDLVARLAERAVAQGIERFLATMLPDNLAVHRLFESIAEGPIERRREGGLSEMEFWLPGTGHAESPTGDVPLAA